MAKRAKASGAPLSEAELIVLLREKFAAPEFAFMPHVRNGTGWSRRTTRTADALAMSLWPSRGLELWGFELKSERADWMREKLAPEKAEEIGQFCDRWWVVTGAADIVRQDDLFPPPWGLMEARDGKLVVAREALKLEAKPLDRAQLAAILRRAAECVVPRAEIEAEVARAREQAEKGFEARVEAHTLHIRHQLQQLSEKVSEFEAASGVKIVHGWNLGTVGKAVDFIVRGGLEHQEERLRGLLETAEQITGDLRARLAELPAAPAATGTEG